jgi:hypothetical protein
VLALVRWLSFPPSMAGARGEKLIVHHPSGRALPALLLCFSLWTACVSNTVLAGNFNKGDLHGECLPGRACNVGTCTDSNSGPVVIPITYRSTCEFTCAEGQDIDCPAGLACTVSTGYSGPNLCIERSRFPKEEAPPMPTDGGRS